MNARPDPISPEELEAGLAVARTHKVAVFVVAYNAEAHIEETLRRIPESLRVLLSRIYVIDDCSQDATVGRAKELADSIDRLEVYRTPFNQGYGGNQKIGYRSAIERGDDIVVLLHGDGQYAPEMMPRMLAPFASRKIDAVFGSRMMVKGAARRGRMPFYKRVGNRVLTFLENRMMSAKLTEWHSGYRAYRVSSLARLPFDYNSNMFHFDTQIIVQLLGSGMHIQEVPIPTHYGDEICRVNGVPYAFRCVRTILHYRLTGLELLYHPRYDLEGPPETYEFKHAPNTVHQYVLNRAYEPGEAVVDLGAAGGHIASAVHEKGAEVVGVDAEPAKRDLPVHWITKNLDEEFAQPIKDKLGRPADTVLALDVIEHLIDPETGVREIQALLRSGGRLVASTGNVAYLPLRLMMLLGHFNYGKRGILDLTHKRLFTLGSFRRLLNTEGFRVTRTRAFGPPITDMVGGSAFLKLIDRTAGWLARLWPRMFAYQILVEATRLDTLEDITRRTVRSERATDSAAPHVPQSNR